MHKSVFANLCGLHNRIEQVQYYGGHHKERS